MSATSKYRAALEASTQDNPTTNNVTPLRPALPMTLAAQAPKSYKYPIYSGLTVTQPSRFVEGDARGSLAGLSPVIEVAEKEAAPLFSVAVLRDDRLIVPHGDTMLYAGDEVVVLVTDESEAEVRELLIG